MWRASILTIFPEMFPGPLALSLACKALAAGLWGLDAVDIRAHATDKHRSVDDTPAGTIGFRASDRLSREDLADVILPPIREAIDRGEKLRLLFEIDRDFDGLAPGAAWQDFKADIELGLDHRAAWERFAIVSDLNLDVGQRLAHSA